MLHAPHVPDGDTKTDEDAWQGGSDFTVAAEDALQTTVVLLWSAGRLHAVVVARGAPGAFHADAVTLTLDGALGRVDVTTSPAAGRAPLAVRSGGAVAPLPRAAASVEQGDVDWFAELSMPAPEIGIAPAPGLRVPMTATRCATALAKDAERRCVSSDVLLVFDAEDAEGP